MEFLPVSHNHSLFREDTISDFKSPEFRAEYEKTAEELGGKIVIEEDGFPSIVLKVDKEPSPWEV